MQRQLLGPRLKRYQVSEPDRIDYSASNDLLKVSYDAPRLDARCLSSPDFLLASNGQAISLVHHFPN